MRERVRRRADCIRASASHLRSRLCPRGVRRCLRPVLHGVHQGTHQSLALSRGQSVDQRRHVGQRWLHAVLGRSATSPCDGLPPTPARWCVRSIAVAPAVPRPAPKPATTATSRGSSGAARWPRARRQSVANCRSASPARAGRTRSRRRHPAATVVEHAPLPGSAPAAAAAAAEPAGDGSSVTSAAGLRSDGSARPAPLETARGRLS
jgi:hypothetical protein